MPRPQAYEPLAVQLSPLDLQKYLRPGTDLVTGAVGAVEDQHRLLDAVDPVDGRALGKQGAPLRRARIAVAAIHELGKPRPVGRYRLQHGLQVGSRRDERDSQGGSYDSNYCWANRRKCTASSSRSSPQNTS